MRTAYVLGFLPPYVRSELERLSALGVETEVWLPRSDSFWDSITGSELPGGSVAGGAKGDLLVGSPSTAEMARALSSTMRRFLISPVRMARHAGTSLGASGPSFLVYGARLADALSRNPPDRIHSHFAWEPAAAAMWASKLLGIPFSLTVHAADIFRPRNPGTVGMMLAHASPLFTISDFNRRFIAGRWGDAVASGAVVTHLGIDPDSLPHAVRGGTGDGLIWCTASGLAEKKGVPDLLEACRLLEGSGNGWHCVIAGSDRDGCSLARFRELAGDLVLSGRVEMPGSLPSPEVLIRTSAASVAVLPCIRASDGDMDGIPVALMEAMGMGVPVVSTRLSGIPELIEDGVSGILVEPGDPSALARSIRRLLDDPAAAARLGYAGRRRVSEHFTAASHARRMLDAWLSRDA